MEYDITELKKNVDTATKNFTKEQQDIYETIMKALTNNDESCQIFIAARGGCGKTYLLNAILDAVRASEQQE